MMNISVRGPTVTLQRFFKLSVIEWFRVMKPAIEKKDYQTINRATLSLKGASNFLGATSINHACSALLASCHAEAFEQINYRYAQIVE